MKKLKLTALVALLCIVSFAVAFSKEAAGPKEAADPEKAFRRSIKVDKSGKKDVLDILGEPHIKTITDYSNFKPSGVPFVDGDKILPKEVWTYVSLKKGEVWKRSNAVVTLGGVVFAHNVKLIIVSFDDKGKVTGYELTDVAG